MAVPRVLLLSSSVPGAPEVGGIILRDLLQEYPAGRAAALLLESPTTAQVSIEPTGLASERWQLPFVQGAPWGTGRWGALRTALHYAWSEHLGLRPVRRAASAWGRRHGSTICWAVLDHPLVYDLARYVAADLGVPLVVTVWDPPESVGLNVRLDRFSRQRAQMAFDRTLRAAHRCAVMSEAMAARYEQLYGVETLIMRHGLAPEMHQHPAPGLAGRKQLTIGFCGSLYALDEWRGLLAALQAADWTIAGREVRIRVLAGALPLQVAHATRIEWLGWRPVAETVRLLAECDLNYLPYWFDPARRVAVQLCFPTKLSTYFASGRPVLFHGPADASVPGFFERYPAGFCCPSQEPEALRAILTQAVEDEAAYAAACDAVVRARTTELSREVFHARFRTLVGAPPALAGDKQEEGGCAHRVAVRAAAQGLSTSRPRACAAQRTNSISE